MPVDQEARRARLWRNTDRKARVLEGRWERAFQRLFAKQRTATLSRLEGNRGRKLLKGDVRQSGDEVFDPAYWTEETRETADGLFEQVATTALADLADRFDIDFDLDDPLVRDFITSRANMLAGQVTDTTYQQITEALAAGVAEGEGIPDLVERVRHVFDVADKQRATVIARTEVVSAYNGAATMGATSLPGDVVAGAEWIATRDGRTRPAHASADGQIVPVGSRFSVGGDELAYPGDPIGRASNTVQCRCTVAYLTTEEMQQSFEGMAWFADFTRAASVLRMVREGSQVDARLVRAATEVRHAA